MLTDIEWPFDCSFFKDNVGKKKILIHKSVPSFPGHPCLRRADDRIRAQPGWRPDIRHLAAEAGGRQAHLPGYDGYHGGGRDCCRILPRWGDYCKIIGWILKQYGKFDKPTYSGMMDTMLVASQNFFRYFIMVEGSEIISFYVMFRSWISIW